MNQASLHKKQTISYIICIIVTVLIAFAIKPSYPDQPKGIFLPNSAQQAAPISPNQVQLIAETMPLELSGTPLGHINIEIHLENTQSKTLQKAQQKVRDYAKKLAAANGGNLVVVNRIGYGGAQPLTVYVLKATVFSSQ